MDLETENRIAAILLRDAAELRRQAEKEGVLAYLRKPNVRGQPNARFLTATVRGIQQANRAVEVNEMWRVRQKELELDDRLKARGRSENSWGCNNHGENQSSSRSTSDRHALNGNSNIATSSTSMKASVNCYAREDEGLKDEEVEEFLRSRAKRGRGTVGSRMDETGPYLPSAEFKETSSLDSRWQPVVLGPPKPPSMSSYGESSEEGELEKDRQKKAKKERKKDQMKKSSDKYSRKHKTKERSADEKMKRKERRSKH